MLDAGAPLSLEPIVTRSGDSVSVWLEFRRT